MNANVNITANNTYNVSLIDSRTGKVRQEGSFHNIMLKAFNRMLVYSTGTSTAYEDGWLTNIFEAIECGSDTTPPSAADTALKAPLWKTFAPDSASGSNPVEYPSVGTARRTCTYTIPAGLDYVGTVTEVGLHARICGPDSYWRPGIGPLCTRALLTDSEGHVISFNKTDLDILKITVTVELSIVSDSENFSVFRNPIILNNILAFAPYCNHFFAHGSFEVRRFALDCKNNYAIASETNADKIAERGVPVAIDQVLPLSYKCTNNGERVGLDWLKSRLASTTVIEERYYKALVLNGLGGWMLPNESIFPAYSITGIPIGTGDGSTVSFTAPLSYFKKDTDKVYKNGVLLTRGVDYTLSNVNNAKKLEEVSGIAGTLPTYVHSESTLPITKSDARPLLSGSLQPYRIDRDGITYFFNSTAPLKFRYEKPVTLNYIRAAVLRVVNSSNSVNSCTYDFTLECSDDDEVYTEVVTAKGPNFDVSFVDTTAKYWQITTTCPSTLTIYCYTGDSYLTVGYSAPYITFTEAPAEGDILTMDVMMDVMMKNDKFVIDAEASIDFSIS